MLSIEKTFLDNIKDEDNYKSYLKNLFSNIYKDTIIDINYKELEEFDNDLHRIDKISLNCDNINDELIQRNFKTFINNFNKIYILQYPNMKLLSIIPKELFATSKLKKLNIELEDGFIEYFSDIILPNLTEFDINRNNTSDSYVTKFFSIILKSCPIMERFKYLNCYYGIKEVFEVDIDIDLFNYNDIITLLLRSKKQDFHIYFKSSNEYVKLAKIMIEYSQSLFNKIKNIKLNDIKDNISNYLPKYLNRIKLNIEDLMIMINNDSFKNYRNN